MARLWNVPEKRKKSIKDCKGVYILRSKQGGFTKVFCRFWGKIGRVSCGWGDWGTPGKTIDEGKLGSLNTGLGSDPDYNDLCKKNRSEGGEKIQV